jgi:hypothetical protein
MMPNQTVEYPRITPGIARVLGAVTDAGVRIVPQSESGGGDLNGTAALILRAHAGTGLGQSDMPRLAPSVGGI